MKAVVLKVMLRERKFNNRRLKKRRNRLTPRMERTKELVKEGYSVKKAMELVGYAQSTINSSWQHYLTKLDLPELLRGLNRTGSPWLPFPVPWSQVA